MVLFRLSLCTCLVGIRGLAAALDYIPVQLPCVSGDFVIENGLTQGLWETSVSLAFGNCSQEFLSPQLPEIWSLFLTKIFA